MARPRTAHNAHSESRAVAPVASAGAGQVTLGSGSCRYMGHALPRGAAMIRHAVSAAASR
ncbi:hypothetical protein JH274_11505 [Xanthomonas campestris pv. incanae]|nr:hypothetical protein JH274_11505 [Xanthomonas campestris pv. incanae]